MVKTKPREYYYPRGLPLSFELTLESFSQTFWQLDNGFVQCIQLCFDTMKQIQGYDDRKPDIADKRQDLVHFCSPRSL